MRNAHGSLYGRCVTRVELVFAGSANRLSMVEEVHCLTLPLLQGEDQQVCTTLILRSHRRVPSRVRLVDCRTEQDPRVDQNVDTALGNLPLQCGNLSLTEACRGIDGVPGVAAGKFTLGPLWSRDDVNRQGV